MRVLMIEDHPAFCIGVEQILNAYYKDVNFIQVRRCEEVAELAINAERIDLVLLDLQLPGVSNIEALKMVRAMYPEIPVVIISSNCDPAIVNRAIHEGGAMGYISKATNRDLLKGAIDVVLAGGVYLPADVVLAARGLGEGAAIDCEDVLSQLTDRQRDVLRLMVVGSSNKYIARALNIGETTVKTHVDNIRKIFGAPNRTAVLYAMQKMGLKLESISSRETRPVTS